MNKLIVLVVAAAFIISCSKERSVERNGIIVSDSALGLLQHKWTADSADVFGSTDFTVPPAIGTRFSPGQYWDFRNDGKVYSYFGYPTVDYDTGAYAILPDKTGFTFTYTEAAVVKTDTAHFIRLTATELQFYNINRTTGDVGRYFMKR